MYSGDMKIITYTCMAQYLYGMHIWIYYRQSEDAVGMLKIFTWGFFFLLFDVARIISIIVFVLLFIISVFGTVCQDLK